jgi:putative oxidoreductase
MLSGLSKYRDLGLLILRVGIGIAFIVHGAPKMFGGPARWAGLANFVGIPVFPAFFGFLAALGEFGGGICMVLGLFFRPAVFLMFGTMMGALVAHLGAGDGFRDFSHALEMGIVFLGLVFIGPGAYSLDDRLGLN